MTVFYHHLILWDDEKETVAGVYRYTLPDLERRPATAENLVTSSIFDLSPEFKRILPKAMELGASGDFARISKELLSTDASLARVSGNSKSG